MKPSKRGPSQGSRQSSSSFALSPIVWQAGIALLVILGTFALFKMTADEVKDMRAANDEQLKALFFGDRPQIVYCAKGGRDETVPGVIASYKAAVSNRVGVAMINCSHILPSGKNVWDRFKLIKDWKPVVFSLAPWAKPKQISPTSMKDITVLRKYLDTALLPRGTEVSSDKDLAKHCGFGSATSVMETCLVIVKGSRYGKTHSDMEEKFVRANARIKIASVDGTKNRLSFESLHDSPPDTFALRLHAIRNGTHFHTMTFPATIDYLLSFAAEALGSPIETYTEAKGGVKMVKVAASAFKDRSAPREKAPPNNDAEDVSGKEKRKKTKKGDENKDGAGGSTGGGNSEGARSGIHEGGYNVQSESEEDAEVIEL